MKNLKMILPIVAFALATIGAFATQMVDKSVANNYNRLISPGNCQAIECATPVKSVLCSSVTIRQLGDCSQPDTAPSGTYIQ